MSASGWAGDLSKYRTFQFGTDLETVSAQVGATPSQAKVVHSRPALIQELEWRPRGLGPYTGAEAASDVVFTFYDGELYRIRVDYDRYEIEGLTAADIVEAVSAIYGTATQPEAPVKAAPERYGDAEVSLARWQDAEHRFDLVRRSYGHGFRLIGVVERLEAAARTAALEATRLDEREAPQRDAERIAAERQAERAKQEEARRVNKPRFRP